MIPILVERLEASVRDIFYDYEIILVEDYSPDKSWAVIENIARTNDKIKGLRLSRNFGQHCAITAGLDHASGDWIVVLDCDLQDQPEEIGKLYAKAKEGYDLVLASRHTRKDRYFKKMLSRLFYKLLSYLTGTEHDPEVANFGIYSKDVIRAVISMREPIRHFPSLVKWIGFNSAKVDVEHAPRLEGKSSYDLRKLSKLAIDIILAYSDKPLVLLIRAGSLLSFGAMIVAIYYTYQSLAGNIVVLGYASLMVSIWFLSGVIMATMGVVGRYVGKTFEGVRNRPLYVIKSRIND